jgi:hypothetical protein
MINSEIPTMFTQSAFNRTYSAPKKVAGVEADATPTRKTQNHRVDLRDEIARLAEQAESARQTAEIQGRHSRDMQKAMEIAARILNGDNVPQSDKDFLLKTSPGMFKMATSARRFDNDNPNDYDALARDRANSDPATRLLGEDMVRLLNTGFGGAVNTQAANPSIMQSGAVSSGSIDLLS